MFVARCNVGMFVRLCFGVSCGNARARSFVCAAAHDRGRVASVAVVVSAVCVCGGRVVAVLAVSVAVSCLWWSRRGCGCGVATTVALWCGVVWCDFVASYAVATRRWMLVFATVFMVFQYPDLRNQLIACTVRAIKQTTTEGTGMNERPPPRRPPPQGR